MMSNIPVISSASNSTEDDTMSNNDSSGDETMSDNNSDDDETMAWKLKSDLRYLSKEDLAQLLVTATLNNPNPAFSVVPQTYIKKSKVNHKDAILARIDGISEKDGFSDTLKLYGSSTPDFDTEEFHAFSRLPPEIRVMIWRFLFPISRAVKISMQFIDNDGKVATSYSPSGDKNSEYHIHDFATFEWRLYSNTQVPVGLHINKESRIETLKHYTPIFCDPDQICPIYGNFSTDIITWEIPLEELDTWAFLSRIISHDSCQNIQRLAISHFEFLKLTRKSNNLRFMMKYLGALQEILIGLDGISYTSMELAMGGAAADDGPMVPKWDYVTKMHHMKEGAWVEAPKPESLWTKTWIDEATSELQKLITNSPKLLKRHPDWKAPALRFGEMCRLELNRKVLALEQDIAEVDRDLEEMGSVESLYSEDDEDMESVESFDSEDDEDLVDDSEDGSIG